LQIKKFICITLVFVFVGVGAFAKKQTVSGTAVSHNDRGMAYYSRAISSDAGDSAQMPELLNMALGEFNLAVKHAPNYYQAYNNAGIILFELGRMPEAEVYFKKAIALKPDYSEAVENYGRVLFARNETDEAIKKYEEAITFNSRNSSAYYHLGEALIAKGRFSEAIKHLQTSIYLLPDSAYAFNMLGKAYEMLGSEAEAVEGYKKAVMVNPDFAAPYLSLADIYKNRGDEEFAMVELRNAIAINPGFYDARLKLAEIALSIGKASHATKYYKELLDAPEHRNRALQGLARTYFQNPDAAAYNDVVQVEAGLQQAFSIAPDDPELCLALLRVSKILKNPGQTNYYFEKIMETAKNSQAGRIVKGETFLALNEYGSAEREFVKAIPLANTDSDLLELAEICYINRVYSPAQIATNTVLSKNKSSLRARKLFKRIIRDKDKAASKMKTAGDFHREKQYDSAIEAYEDAISLDPYQMEAHKEIARLYEKVKNYSLAVEHYKAYINLVDAGRNVRKYQKKIDKLENKLQDNQI